MANQRYCRGQEQNGSAYPLCGSSEGAAGGEGTMTREPTKERGQTYPPKVYSLIAKATEGAS